MQPLEFERGVQFLKMDQAEQDLAEAEQVSCRMCPGEDNSSQAIWTSDFLATFILFSTVPERLSL